MKNTARKSRPSDRSISSSDAKVLRHFVKAASALPSETMWLRARGQSEASLIAAALADAPVLDRDTMGAEMFPFNGIASSERVEAIVTRITRQRDPENPWNGAHQSLLTTDENGKGYAAFVDTFRDAAFLVGVDYALGSLPDWWQTFQALDTPTQQAIGVVVRHAAKGGAR